MIVPKLALISHLDRVHCHGEIGEVVLKNNFAVSAVTPDRQIMVHTLGMPEVEPLPSAVGVVDLPLLINAIKSLGEEEGKISLEFVDHRILVEERGRAKIQMVTGSPETISTKVTEENTETLLSKIKGGKTVVLSQSAVQDVLKTISLLKAESVAVHIEPRMVTWVVGQSTGHFAEIQMPVPGRGKETLTDEPYDLVFNSRPLVAALRQVTDFTQTVLTVTGVDSLTAISDTRYTYLLAPVRK